MRAKEVMTSGISMVHRVAVALRRQRAAVSAIYRPSQPRHCKAIGHRPALIAYQGSSTQMPIKYRSQYLYSQRIMSRRQCAKVHLPSFSIRANSSVQKHDTDVDKAK